MDHEAGLWTRIFSLSIFCVGLLGVMDFCFIGLEFELATLMDLIFNHVLSRALVWALVVGGDAALLVLAGAP